MTESLSFWQEYGPLQSVDNAGTEGDKKLLETTLVAVQVLALS